MAARVAVVGAGISGASCAVELRAGGLDVGVFERGRTAGGRMASPTTVQRRTDLGAAYFTVADDDFAEQVESWRTDGLARPWTKTFDVISADGRTPTTGPMRWASPEGLRSLVQALEPAAHAGNEITDLGDLDHDAIVLAMPDPQAARLVPARLTPSEFDWIAYDPVISVAFAWTERCWELDAAAFVNDDPDVTFIADDGSRRGDRAAVLVAHTTSELAREHLDDPDSAVSPTFAAVRRLLGIRPDPIRTYAHRWTFAKPSDTHGDEPFGMLEVEGRPLGLCGDSWCPSGSPRVEAAWLSGMRVGRELVDQLA